MKHPAWLSSSADSDKLSRTIKSLPTLIIFVAMMLKIDIPESEIDNWIQLLLIVINGVITLYYGSIRVWNKYLKPWRNARR